MSDEIVLPDELLPRLAELFTRRQVVHSAQFVEDQTRLVEVEIQAILGAVRVMAGVPADWAFRWDGVRAWFESTTSVRHLDPKSSE